jgi:hypothetical protein
MFLTPWTRLVRSISASDVAKPDRYGARWSQGAGKSAIVRHDNHEEL